MRPALVAVHRSAALFLGGFIALMGLSGASLLFRDAIEDRIHPERVLEGTARPISYEAVLRGARAAVPDAKRYSITAGDPGNAFRVETDGAQRRVLFIDPRDGRVMANAGRTEYALDWIERLHTHLLAGGIGEACIGILGLALLLLATTGLVQAWPRRLSSAFRIRWRAPSPWFAYDLHRVAGLATCLFLSLNALTGIVLALSGAAAAIVNFVAQAPPVKRVAPPPRTRRERAPLDDVVKAAERAITGARASQVMVPSEDGLVTVRVHAPGDHLPLGLGSVVVDPADATALEVVPRAAQRPGQRMFDWIFPLHTGALIGLPYRVFMVLVGLAPAILFATGLVVWAGRRRPKAGAAMR